MLRPYGFTIFGFGGGFAFFTYAEAWITGPAGLSQTATGLLLGLVGLGALAGNILGGTLTQRLGRSAALGLSLLAQLAGLALLANHPGPGLIAMALLLWSVGGFRHCSDGSWMGH